MADVVGEVEVDVVDPERPAGLQRRHDELLAEARHQAEAAADVLDQVDVARRRALEDQDRADVHVARRLSFDRNEASTAVSRSRWRPSVVLGIAGRQAIRHRYPGTCPATATAAPQAVLLAAPRGYCAGVDRAVQTVERALELHGAPVYVRKEIVHNKHVVEELAKRGAIFVEQETEVPEGEMVVFSAHGVAPAVHENAAARSLRTIDATCPLVTKVHVSARRFAAEGYTIVMIGHEGHEEVEGTTGEAPDSIVLIETADEVDALEVPDPDKVAFITQTTLSVDETAEMIAALRAKFPGDRQLSKSDDICYATTNRQIAVKQLARECDLVLVIGSTNSSNSNRLVEVAREHGAASHLIDNHTQVQEEWLEGVETVGITSGASAPEELVEAWSSFFRERGADDVSELRTVHEDVRFMLPKEIRDELAARA